MLRGDDVARPTGRGPSTHARSWRGRGARLPALTEAERAEFLAVLNRAFDGKVEAIGWGHDAAALRGMLKANAVPHQEVFMVGASMGHQLLGDEAGLPFVKDVDSWLG